jgi:predicted ATPase
MTMAPEMLLPRLSRVKVRNLLSFGPEGVDVKLEPLNVLIGPNATGKSNFLRVLAVLKAAPVDLSRAFTDTDGPDEWAWKGQATLPASFIEATVTLPKSALEHSLSLDITPFFGLHLLRESIRSYRDLTLFPDSPAASVYEYGDGEAQYRGKSLDMSAFEGQPITPVTHPLGTQSVLAILKAPHEYRELHQVSLAYSFMRLYRGWALAKDFPPKRPQPTSQPGWSLEEDASNLAMVINNLETHNSEAFRTIENDLKKIYPNIQKITIGVQNNLGLVYIHEKGLSTPVPAVLVSDGLLRYLCILAVLRNPSVFGLIGIEEPEVGLHPDAILHLAEVLKDAAKRTQVVVTTHSDILVSALSDMPEAIIVCERDETGTHMKRLDTEALREWLKSEFLGQIWLSGGIGGTL